MRISAVDARRRFGELLSRVELTKEEIIIERAGRVIARLVGIDGPGGKTTAPEGRGRLSAARGLGREVWAGVDPGEYVRTERDSWA